MRWWWEGSTLVERAEHAQCADVELTTQTNSSKIPPALLLGNPQSSAPLVPCCLFVCVTTTPLPGCAVSVSVAGLPLTNLA